MGQSKEKVATPVQSAISYALIFTVIPLILYSKKGGEHASISMSLTTLLLAAYLFLYFVFSTKAKEFSVKGIVVDKSNSPRNYLFLQVVTLGVSIFFLMILIARLC